MALKLINHDDELLRTKLSNFDFSNPPIDPVELTNQLIETLREVGGIALSANQCGLPHRAFVLHTAEPFALFNAKVVDTTSETVVLEETCSTHPGLVVKIRRPTIVKVRYQDYLGEWHTEKYIGMTARAILHELDHMDGLDYTRRANPIHLERAKNKKKRSDRERARELKRAI